MHFRMIGLVLILVSAISASADAAPPKAHESLACGSCHQGGGSFGSRVDGRGVMTSTDRDCLDCHRALATSAADGFHSAARGDCTSCHVFHEPSLVKAGRKRFRVDMGRDDHRPHCASCHAAGTSLADLSPGHVEAAAVYHVDTVELNGLSPSDACLRCHSRSGATVDATSPAPRFAEHASHPFGEKVRRGEGDHVNYIRYDLDPRLPLFDDRIECQTCHALSEPTESRLVAFEDPYAMCLGCHAQDAAPRQNRLASAR